MPLSPRWTQLTELDKKVHQLRLLCRLGCDSWSHRRGLCSCHLVNDLEVMTIYYRHALFFSHVSRPMSCALQPASHAFHLASCVPHPSQHTSTMIFTLINFFISCFKDCWDAVSLFVMCVYSANLCNRLYN